MVHFVCLTFYTNHINIRDVPCEATRGSRGCDLNYIDSMYIELGHPRQGDSVIGFENAASNYLVKSEARLQTCGANRAPINTSYYIDKQLWDDTMILKN